MTVGNRYTLKIVFFVFIAYCATNWLQDLDFTAIDRATVHSDGTMTFHFIGGMEIAA